MRGRGLALALLLAACGKSDSGGASSPDAPIRAVAVATSNGDAAAIRRAIVSPGRLRQAISCHGEDSVVVTLEKALDSVDHSAADLKDPARAARYEIVSVKQTGQRQVAKGDSYRDCVANEPFEVRMLAVRQRVRIGDTDDTGEETNEVIRLDGHWYAMPRE